MKIVILTQYYPPETGAPQRRLSHLAGWLAKRGHDVHVVTAMPNYPTGRVFPPWRGKLLAAERGGAEVVLRSWLYTSSRRTTPAQLATYLSFALTAAVTAPLRLQRADVLLWESPPLFLAPTAHLLARRLRAKLVMNVSDVWPQSAVELGLLRDPRLIAFFERWEAWAYRSADLVTYQTEGIGTAIERRAPGTARFFFPNGVDTATFRRVEPRAQLRAEFGVPADRPLVGYAGNLGRAQGLEQVLEAAAILARNPAGPTFLLVGDGPRREALMARGRALGLGNVHLAAPFPAERMPELLSLFDLAVVPLADAPIFDGARPSKMFELFSVGVPFVYCGRGEGAAVAKASGGAEVTPPGDPPALARAILRLLDAGEAARREAGRTARQFAVDNFDRARIAMALERRLDQLTATVGPDALAHHPEAPKATSSRTIASAACPSP